MANSTCTIADCTRKIYFRDKCHSHYVRVGPRRAGVCKIAECAAVAKSQGLCDKHYTRLRRHNNPSVTLRASRDASLVERLEFTGWTEVTHRPELGPCWEWSGGRYASNYGQVSTGANETQPAHRVAHVAWIGPIGEGLDVCHRCDNPPCISPAHLFEGTRKDNMGDCAQKDRSAHGERQGGHKLTADEVRDIRAAYATGKFTQRELGAAYGVAQTNISATIRRVTWARVA